MPLLGEKNHGSLRDRGPGGRGSGGLLGTRTSSLHALLLPRASRLRPGTSLPRRRADDVIRTPAPDLVAWSGWHQEPAGRAGPAVPKTGETSGSAGALGGSWVNRS